MKQSSITVQEPHQTKFHICATWTFSKDPPKNDFPGENIIGMQDSISLFPNIKHYSIWTKKNVVYTISVKEFYVTSLSGFLSLSLSYFFLFFLKFLLEETSELRSQKNIVQNIACGAGF
jgi:hypothetical protein